MISGIKKSILNPLAGKRGRPQDVVANELIEANKPFYFSTEGEQQTMFFAGHAHLPSSALVAV